ncbi:hypothetical protein AZE42_13941, partial [Rhizopogon vesiculosus]
CFETQQLLLL